METRPAVSLASGWRVDVRRSRKPLKHRGVAAFATVSATWTTIRWCMSARVIQVAASIRASLMSSNFRCLQNPWNGLRHAGLLTPGAWLSPASI